MSTQYHNLLYTSMDVLNNVRNDFKKPGAYPLEEKKDFVRFRFDHLDNKK